MRSNIQINNILRNTTEGQNTSGIVRQHDKSGDYLTEETLMFVIIVQEIVFPHWKFSKAIVRILKLSIGINNV